MKMVTTAVLLILSLVAVNANAANFWESTIEPEPESTWTEQVPNLDADTFPIGEDFAAYPWLDRVKKHFVVEVSEQPGMNATNQARWVCHEVPSANTKKEVCVWMDPKTSAVSAPMEIQSAPNVPTAQRLELAGGNYWTGGCKVWDWTMGRLRNGFFRV